MARRKYPVKLSNRASLMLIRHAEFLARVSPAAARKLIASFRKATVSIENNPFSCPYADDLDIPGIPKQTYRKCLFFERYKALYTLEDDTAYIDAIVDCRQENSDLY
jgi:hypothetical protein